MADIENLIKSGRDFFDDKDYENALKIFEGIIEKNPKIAKVWFNMGRTLAMMNRIDDALKSYDEALKLDSQYRDVWNNRGTIFQEKNNFDEALKCHKKSLEIDPSYDKGYLNMAYTLLKLNKIDESKKNYEKYLELTSSEGDIFSRRGFYLLDIKQLDESLTNFEKALEINPKDHLALNGIGNIYHEKKDYLNAIKYYIKSHNAKPDYVVPLINKGIANAGLRRLNESLFCFSEALEIDPTDELAILHKADVYILQRKFEDALAYPESLLKINPNNLRALHQKGEILFSQKHYKEAIQCFRKINEMQNNPSSWNYLAWGLTHEGYNEEALRLIEKALEKEPENSYYIDTKALILHNLKEFQQALKEINKALGIEPKDSEFWYRKGIIQISREDYKDAIRCLDKCIELDSLNTKGLNANALNAKSKALSKTEKTDSAIQMLKKAISIEPNFSEAHENLAKAFRSESKGYQNFWEFWSISKSRKSLVATLAIFASLIVINPIIFGYDMTETYSHDEIIIKKIIKNYEVPYSHLTVLGFIIFVIMSPMIRKAKVGPVEFELGETAMSSSKGAQAINITLNTSS